MGTWARFGLAAIVAVLGFGVGSGGITASATTPADPSVVSVPVHMDVSPPLGSLEPANYNFESALGNDRPAKPVPTRGGDAPVGGTSPTPPAKTAPAVGTSFEGIGRGLPGYSVFAAPPDPNGAVGPNHYVEVVNTDYAVFNKSGTLLYGPVPINTVFSGFGGGCERDNDGDPTVLYDRNSDRWLISQFAVTTTRYLNCVAVSTSPDPLGTYYRYSYSYTDFPDYPKFGIWPDGYYVSMNMFAGGTTFSGGRACSYDRAKMLTGQAATQQCFSTGINYGGLLPSTVDGSRLPPAGAPDYFVALDTNSTLVSWKFHVDWSTPANSTFTGPNSLNVAPYTMACGGGTCIPQPGTTQRLDSLADRLMYRLAYRNFGDHEALVVNHSVTAGSSVGVRWYELRVSSGNLSLFQQGTYAPDSNFRWMGSIAMDQAGNMGLGYSVSSSTLAPSIRYTGRLASDPLGTMPQGEGTIIAGTGSQNNGLSRWGDYTSMVVDPFDDCTFWYTNEYLNANGSFNWSTRVGTFKFPNCSSVPDFSLAVTPSSQSVVQGAGTSYSVAISPSSGFNASVSLDLSGLPSGAGFSFGPNPATSSSTLTVTTTASTPAGTYPLTITGASGALSHTAAAVLVVTTPVSPDYAVSVSPSSRTVIAGASAGYTITISPVGGFSGPVALSVSGLPSGASGAFSPNPATNSSVLTVTTTTGMAPTNATFTITGVSGGLSHSTTATLVVTAPTPATVSCSPASGSVRRNGVVKCTWTPGSNSSFSGWTTARFTPTSSTNPSQSFTATTIGSASIVAQWTDGGVTKSQTFTYTVTRR